MSYREIIKPVRNKMREFGYHSVLAAASNYLIETDAQGPDRERAARLPWVAERIALWALRDEPGMYRHAKMSQDDLRRCINQAWNGIDASDVWRKNANPLALLMRQMLLAQAPHQQNREMGAFARQIDLLGRLEPNSRLRQLIESHVGMRAEVYLQVAFFLWLKASEGIGDVFAPAYLETLTRAFSNQAMERFWRTIITPRHVARRELKDFDEDEWFQPNVLYRFPFVESQRQLYFWGAPCLHRHIEYAFSDIVARADDGGAKQAFEDAFEAYVGETLGRSGFPVLNEGEIRRRFRVDGRCSDFLVVEDTATIVFEVKNKSLSLDLPASAPVNKYKTKFQKTLLKANTQLANVASHVRQAPEFAGKPIHRVIVTYGDLMLGQANYLFPDGDHAADPVLILSIDELDHLVEAVRLKRCTMGEFFADFLVRSSDPVRALFAPGQLLADALYRQDHAPAHLVAIYDAILDPITERFRQLGAQNVLQLPSS
ncbi:hypothetical protein [Ralstonia pickettii]|uniref:hypothetical protein n=1 Tax=Ralstonia pickettii TaxID=329 RepID=UPI00046A9E2A|nr:hypothetical protein [Ralstonia pickettii]